MRVSYLLCNSHFFEAILVFSKNLNSFSLPIFVLNRYSIDFWSLSNPSNASTLSARYSEHSSTKWVGFWYPSSSSIPDRTTDHLSKQNHETCIDCTTNAFETSSCRLRETGITSRRGIFRRRGFSARDLPPSILFILPFINESTNQLNNKCLRISIG